MWAVFDKDGIIQQVDDDGAGCAWDLYRDCCNWKLRELPLEDFIEKMKAEGYTCQPVVVMREEVYNGMSGWTKTVAKGWDKFNYPVIEEFLKAGE